MSLVGPRPYLPSQKKLIIERKKRSIFKVKPGLTGLAQLSDIDMSTPTLLAKKDLKMIKKFNLYYIFLLRHCCINVNT
jgi:O-antigen biosynthesis protein WbqP